MKVTAPFVVCFLNQERLHSLQIDQLCGPPEFHHPRSSVLTILLWLLNQKMCYSFYRSHVAPEQEQRGCLRSYWGQKWPKSEFFICSYAVWLFFFFFLQTVWKAQITWNLDHSILVAVLDTFVQYLPPSSGEIWIYSWVCPLLQWHSLTEYTATS